MNPAEIDPSLRSGQRPLDSLEDGFSPPVPDLQEDDLPAPVVRDEAESIFGTKSPF
jgi:hypothetical protein